ncbi:MAG: tyrosine-type recombinase/integrase [Pseudomonadota bacterium]
MPLSDLKIRNAKHEGKNLKIADEKGMYLFVTATNKSFRMDYRYGKDRKTETLGKYPDVSLAKARARRDESRAMLADGKDPMVEKKKTKVDQHLKIANTFETVGLEWFATFKVGKTSGHAEKTYRRLANDVFPWLGKRPIHELAQDVQSIKSCLDRIISRGAIETAHRAMQNIGQIFRYGMITGKCPSDPTIALKGALPTPKVIHHASITDTAQIGGLLRAIDGYQGAYLTRYALQLAPLVFVRPGELRQAEWAEFDLEKAEWRIPAERMKMRETHIVPLSTQAIRILRELAPLTSSKKYLFTGARTNGRPMSENTINAALRRLGYEGNEMTGHGFRSMASTLLNEHGWNIDAIERQLAHAERNSIRAAYNYAEYLPERKKMMQAWADYLEQLKQGAEVIPLIARNG